MEKWVDTHCHLFMEKFPESERESAIKEIKENLEFAVLIGTTVRDSKLHEEFVTKESNFYYMKGIHPGHVEEFSKDFVESVQNTLKSENKERFVGIGEIGLDYTYENRDDALQKKVYEAQLDLAQKMDVPVVIHARESILDCLSILKNYPQLKNVVFHCFTGNMKEAQAILNQGYHISFTGVITFPKSQELRDIVKIVPDNKIMVETDTPFLTPVPFRGKLNRPLYVSYVGEMVASVKEISIPQAIQLTTQNAYQFFRIPFSQKK
jgi:TatD DNase family protein